MATQSRRGLLKNAAIGAAVITGGAVTAGAAAYQTAGKLAKKRYPANTPEPNPGAPVPLYSPAVGYGNLLFLSGVGVHFEGDITSHTKAVLDMIEQRLTDSGSSLEKVISVNVFLNDIKDYDAMNAVYATRNWGPIHPARTTTAAALGGIPGKALVEINCIAHL
jgi:2-iminobutanoate/2-iminopropanoate deaminase